MGGKLIMCKGLPGSGKSTWAKSLVEPSLPAIKRVLRVNKDDIRAKFGVEWSPEVEKKVLLERDRQISMGLSSGQTVISDDTNLAPKHEARLKGLCTKYKAEFEVNDSFLGVPIETCIERDLGRDEFERVGEKVIWDMYKQFLEPKIIAETVFRPYVAPKDGTPAIIVDLDGTLCLHVNRSPYDTSMCFTDKENKPILDLITLVHSDNTAILYVSGREDKFREMSQNWLDSHGAPPGQLWMRPTGDLRNDAIVKAEIFNREIREKFRVRFVLDDRDRVVKMWRELGLTCLQVAYGSF